MTEPIEETYFNWLCAQVLRVNVPTPSLTFSHLLQLLHRTEFTWSVAGDDNRAEDGLELRYSFLTESHVFPDSVWSSLSCSLFEMLLAFSYRAEFETNMLARDWFWIFMTNLGLSEANDASYTSDADILNVLNCFVWRTYRKNGSGGLFPMNHTRHDQRRLELWYQFFEYLEDQNLV